MEIQYLVLSERDKTKLRIIDAIDRPIDEMSVSNICEKAGISRPTFYSHFPSKYDIAIWFSLQSGALHLDTIGRTLTWRQGFERHFSTLATQKMLYSNAVSSKYTHSLMLEVQSQRIQILKETLCNWKHITLNEDWEFMLSAYTYLEESMTIDWTASNFSMDPIEFARRLELCVPEMLYDALSL